MAFDNVTLFEINVADPLGDETTDAEPASEPDEPVADSATADAGGNSALWLLGLVAAVVTIGLAARWLRQRRGESESDYETEEIEPGVERVAV
ncbi:MULTISPECIES: hypothetical protein [Halomicrobium]|uniref:LPXTG cell wall anchor domain-containing protein n=2 Tax=Halomicrobium mukohataei TaxID=57705 RepID=C7P0P7_HALMD|nr:MULTISPECIES: hypothetical protein [Halomicrobium]ACV47029.1 hypothetical protein Hmuk_0900 [Halomicrobium mukohataei DSM 12286]QCD65520.1 hypothetical protein E5139_07660 [Halomicrobium mukohataei]QFR20326.1 hypothetical protein GBQ70_07655 [Halomicrobium sp. ZPS1]